MKIYQPMLFVGLGGTGCQIGVELERRLREELCGPDGRRLGTAKMPYELPSCLQFVYADLNEEELQGVRRRAIPQDEFSAAIDRTQHRVSALVPYHLSYPEVAQSLRVNAEHLVVSWLPPRSGEPLVSPLLQGAGQLPTVGRAALFETLRHGVAAAQQPVLEAIRRISISGEDLQAFSGREGNKIRSVDVFVAFSVAGGTGGGIFYDYLHLIGDALQRSNLAGRIYPLVLMPSAFDKGLGGGRNALLNSGRALLDLFRLVDAQNSGDVAANDIDEARRPDSVSVRYPQEGVIVLRPSTVRTGFLFSRTAGVERPDLHRLMVSLMLSLIAAEQETADQGATPREQQYQSFADNFINDAADRSAPAESGIGNRGVSTGLVASMTVPVEQLADIVASRLLAEAVEEMGGKPNPAESNGTLIDQFFTEANLGPLRTRAPLDFADSQPTIRGADGIVRALNTRMQSMVAQLSALEKRMPEQASELANRYDPNQAVGKLLSQVDVFRLRRVVLGSPDLRDRRDQLGVLRLLDSYGAEPRPPEGVSWAPPQPVDIRNARLRRARWGDEPVKHVIDAQNLWYRWRSRRAWQMAWGEQKPRWSPRSEELKSGLDALVGAFELHQEANQGRFDQQAADLYRPRTAVSYLLPSRGGDLDQFYRITRGQIMAVYAEEHRAMTSAAVVRAMLGQDSWQMAYAEARDRNSEYAVGWVRERLKEKVIGLLRPQDPRRRTLVPSLADLLAAAAGRTRPANVAEDDLTQFRGKLAGLLPAGFAPQGTGPLKVLLSYAASGRDPQVEGYLTRALNLPADRNPTFEYRTVDTESITVVLFRSSMSITEVTEVREVMSTWAAAVRKEQTGDLLKWRQRLGYDFGYLATTAEHRAAILHRLLCAAWNGWITVLEGDPDSPDRVRVDVSDAGQVPMLLNLTPFGRASSWGSLLRAYEEWTIHDDQGIRRDVCRCLMEVLPAGLSARPRQPSEGYLRLLKIADDERARMEGGYSAGTYTNLLCEFWTSTFPTALDTPFIGANNPLKNDLRELTEEWTA